MLKHFVVMKSQNLKIHCRRLCLKWLKPGNLSASSEVRALQLLQVRSRSLLCVFVMKVNILGSVFEAYSLVNVFKVYSL
jgi:hypothetical protein